MPSRAEHRRTAYWIAHLLLKNYLDVGQPSESCRNTDAIFAREGHRRHGPDDCKDCDVLTEEIEKMIEQFRRNGWTDGNHQRSEF